MAKTKGGIFICGLIGKTLDMAAVGLTETTGIGIQKASCTGVYIPECRLHNGPNDLLTYDQDGKPPTCASL